MRGAKQRTPAHAGAMCADRALGARSGDGGGFSASGAQGRLRLRGGVADPAADGKRDARAGQEGGAARGPKPAADRLAAAAARGQGKSIRTLLGHRSECLSAAFHPYGAFFASGSLDTNLKARAAPRRAACLRARARGR